MVFIISLAIRPLLKAQGSWLIAHYTEFHNFPGGMMIATDYSMNGTFTRLINFKVHTLNKEQLSILLNRERRKLLLAKGYHALSNDVHEIHESIRELERIIHQREYQMRNHSLSIR